MDEQLRILTVNKIMQIFFLTYRVLQVTYGILYTVRLVVVISHVFDRVTYHRSPLRRTRLFRLFLFCFIVSYTKVTIIIIILFLLVTCLIKKRVALVLYFREIQQLYILT